MMSLRRSLPALLAILILQCLQPLHEAVAHPHAFADCELCHHVSDTAALPVGVPLATDWPEQAFEPSVHFSAVYASQRTQPSCRGPPFLRSV